MPAQPNTTVAGAAASALVAGVDESGVFLAHFSNAAAGKAYNNVEWVQHRVAGPSHEGGHSGLVPTA